MLSTLLGKLLTVRSKQVLLFFACIACFYLYIKLLGSFWAFLFWILFILSGFVWINRNGTSVFAYADKAITKISQLAKWFNRPGL